MIKYLLLASLLLTACTNRVQNRVKTSNSDIDAGLLFELDGCKIYRFYDGGSRYFTNCKGSTSWVESCGKNCSKNVEVNGGKHD